MLLPEAVRKARKDLGLSQKRLAELAGIQRRQLATLEDGGNVTLVTLRKVLAQLPNLETFTFDAVPATVRREISDAERRRAADSAVELLVKAMVGIVRKADGGLFPDNDDVKAVQDASDAWSRALGVAAPSDAERAAAQTPVPVAPTGSTASAFAATAALARRRVRVGRGRRRGSGGR